MENEFIDKYERLINYEDQFLIHKEDLLNIVKEENVNNGDSYRIIQKLGGLNGLFDRLDVNPTTGLCEDDDHKNNEARKKVFGQNDPVIPYSSTFFQSLCEVFSEKVIIFLLFAATVRLLIDIIEQKGKWFDYCSIYIVVIIVSLIIAITNYSRDVVFTKFQIEIDYKEVRVLRNQIEKLIPKTEIIVGDILIVNAGDILLVDGLIIKAYSISIDTDSNIVKYHNINYKQQMSFGKYYKSRSETLKINEYPVVLSGSKIVRGYAYVLVLAVGNDTHLNKKHISQYKSIRTRILSNKLKTVNVSTKTSSGHPNNNQFEEVDVDKNIINKSARNSISYKKNIDALDNNQEDYTKIKFKEDNSYKRAEIKKAQTRVTKKGDIMESIKISDDNFIEVEKEVIHERQNNNKEIKHPLITPKFQNEVSKESKLTPLQLKLQSVSEVLSKFGVLASIIACIFFVITFLTAPTYFREDYDLLQVIFDGILYGIVICVVAVPEGLELVVTLTLAFSLNKMREEKTLIKNIEACENMACVDCICTDFTGILTQNDMRVTCIFIEDYLLEGRHVRNLREHVSQDLFDFFCEGIAINTIAFSAERGVDVEYFGDPIECGLIRFLKHINIPYLMLRNNILRPIIDSSPYSPDSKVSFTIIEMDEKRDYIRLYVKGFYESLLDLISIYVGQHQMLEQITPRQYEKIKNKCNNILREGNIPLVFCYRDIPRDQYNQTRHAYLNKDREFMNNILRQLTFICIIGLKDELKPNVEHYIKDCQRAGVIVRMVTSQNRESARIAAEKCGIIKHIPESQFQNVFYPYSLNQHQSDSEIIDKNVHHSIKNSNQKEITNDDVNFKVEKYPRTQKHEAIISPNVSPLKVYKSIAGHNYEIIDAQEDLRKFVDIQFFFKSVVSFSSFEFTISDTNKFNNSIEKSTVISRAHARDKFILVAALKKKGSIVAITGDGVSDSLAMKTSHVGISMGYRSSDMSKEAADLILMDDNFKSIITAILYGRNIFDSVRKFLQFQITATIVILVFVLISALPLINFFFYPNQLLWINLVIDIVTVICFSSEQPDREHILNRKPYSLNHNIITRSMIIKITVQSLIQISLLVALLFFGPLLFNISDDIGLNYREWDENNGIHTTIIFNCIIFMQFFNAFISRTLESDDMNIFRNLQNSKIFLAVQPFIIIFQLLIISHGGRITRTRYLSFKIHLVCFFISSFTLLTLPIVKYLPISSSGEDDKLNKTESSN